MRDDWLLAHLGMKVIALTAARDAMRLAMSPPRLMEMESPQLAESFRLLNLELWETERKFKELSERPPDDVE